MLSFLDGLNIISYFVEPRLFRSEYLKVIRWTSTGSIKSVSIKDNNESIGTSNSGSRTIVDSGRHKIDWKITADGAATFRIAVDNVMRVNFNSAHQVSKTFDIECAEYSKGESAGGGCETGYNLKSRPRSRWTYTINDWGRTGGRGRPTWFPRTRNIKTSWVSGGTPLAANKPTASDTTRSGRRYRVRLIVPETQNRYYCDPTGSCTATETRSVTEYFKSKEGDFDLFISKLPSEVEPPVTKKDLKRVKKDIKRIERRDKRILDLVEATTLRRKEFVSIPDIGADTGLTRYRIITPETFEIVGGKTVPRVRYESVRELSPEVVSNFLFRGYEIQQVSPDTPTSRSKIYGKTFIERTKLLMPEKLRQQLTVAPVRVAGRVTWKDVNLARAAITIPVQRKGGVIHRQEFKVRTLII